MYYTYNSLTGRLIGTNQLRANYPQGLETLRPSEPVSPYSSQHLQRKVEGVGPQRAAKSQQPARPASTNVGSGGIQYSAVSKRLRLLQEKFQINDGVPVHLKGGPMDKVLFLTTVALGVVGMGLCLNNIYIMAFPRPPPSE